MTFGGLRTTEAILVHPSQIRTHDFVGCIRNFHVNGILLRPSMALAAYNIFDRQAKISACRYIYTLNIAGYIYIYMYKNVLLFIFRCPRAAVSLCYSVPCKNGGVCHDLWSNYFCECKSPFTGKNCDKGINNSAYDIELLF